MPFYSQCQLPFFFVPVFWILSYFQKIVNMIILDETFAALDPQTLEQSLRCVLRRAKIFVIRVEKGKQWIRAKRN